MKKWKDTTKGGYKILSIHGPDSSGRYAGAVVDDNGDYDGCVWDEGGNERVYGIHTFDLVPAEPEVEYEERSVSFLRLPTAPVQTLKLGFDKDTGKLLTAEVIA